MRLRLSQRAVLRGLLFASPWIVGFLIFQLIPLIASAYFSLTNFNLFQDPQFVGLRNYQRLASDELFWKSLFNTLYLTVIGVPFIEILKIARDLDLPMIVMGVKGRSTPPEEVLFGSTAEKVLRGARVPVLVVPY